MSDYYLKFASEAQANDVLYPEVTIITTSYDEENNAVDTVTTERKPIDYTIDTIGVLYDMLDDEAISLDGWHVNLRGAETDAFDAYKVEPVVPRRVFA